MSEEVQAESTGSTPVESLQANADAIGVMRAKAQGDTEEVSAVRERVEEDAASIADLKEQVVAEAGIVSSKRVEVEADCESIKAARKTAESENTAIEELLEKAKESEEGTAKLAAKADTVEKALKNYEEGLKELTSEYENLKTKIEGLLPGATSAGLASSFETRKKRFILPQRVWGGTFASCMVGLVVLALVSPAGFIHFDQIVSWDTLFFYILKRLPVAGPVIWLAIFAARRYRIAARLEEEYGYKEAISRSFEGYKREMGTLAETGGDSEPLITLCENVLRTLAQEPGRIYDKNNDEPTPLSEAGQKLKDAVATQKN